MKNRTLLGIGLCMMLSSRSTATPPNILQKRLVYYQTTITTARLPPLFKAMQDAASLGYNGFVVPFGDDAKATAQVVAQANQLGLTIIPYNGFMGNPAHVNYSLIDTFPVQKTPFVIQNGQGVLLQDPAEQLVNPGFEDWSNGQPQGWQLYHSGNENPFSKDTTNPHSGNACLLIHNPAGNGHIGAVISTVPVKPHRAYQFSVWMRLDNVTANQIDDLEIRILSTNGNKPSWTWLAPFQPMGNPGAAAAIGQWVQYKVQFYSAENTSLSINFGTWHSTTITGDIRFDDAQFEEIGLYKNVVRSGYPIVQSQSLGTVYTPGSDYQIGAYDGQSTTPLQQQLNIPAGSRIHDGDHVDVTWLMSTEGLNTGNDQFATSCLPGFIAFQKNALGRDNTRASQPPAFLIAYDEIRTDHWSPECTGSAVDTRAGVASATENMLDEIAPQARHMFWNDPFDPYHDAHDDYFHVNGNLTGSYRGLSKKAIIVNWHSDARVSDFDPQNMPPLPAGAHDLMDAGLLLFSQLGNEQIMGGYNDSLDNVQLWLAKLTALEQSPGLSCVDGFMYETWLTPGDYSYTSLKAVRDAFAAAGRWGSGPVDFSFTCGQTSTQTPPPLAVPALGTLPSFLNLSDTLNITNAEDYRSVGAVSFLWVFVPQPTNGASAAPHTSPTNAITFTTPSLSLTPQTIGLSPGRYDFTVTAHVGSLQSDSAKGSITLVSDTLADARVYPNPWRVDRHNGLPVTFDHLSANSTIKIFTLAGRWVKTLEAPGGSTTWDLTTDNGDHAASGIYLYLITNDQGQKSEGKLVLIR